MNPSMFFPSASSMPPFAQSSFDDRQQPQQVPGIHVSADGAHDEAAASYDLLQSFGLVSNFSAHSFDSLLPPPVPSSSSAPTAPWSTVAPLPQEATGLTVPQYAGSSNGSSEAASTSEAELLFASIMANASPSPSPSPRNGSFLPDQGVFYIPVDDGRGSQTLAAISWDDFRGFLTAKPSSVESGDLSKAARTLAICKPIQTTFSGVTPPLRGGDLHPSPTSPTGSSSSPGHSHRKLLAPSNSGRRHRGPRIRSPTEKALTSSPFAIQASERELKVWWDQDHARAVPGPFADVRGNLSDNGYWISFPAGEWFRVFHTDPNTNKRTEVFPWSHKEMSNHWIRGQALGLGECPCGEFSFFTQTDDANADPFKRPSVIRKHFGDCPKRSEDHPLRLLSQLQAGANVRHRARRAPQAGPTLPPVTSGASTAPSFAQATPAPSSLPFTASTSAGAFAAPFAGLPLFPAFPGGFHA